jgi:hypothetical protein
VRNSKLAAEFAYEKAGELYEVGEKTAAGVWTRCEQVQEKVNFIPVQPVPHKSYSTKVILIY